MDMGQKLEDIYQLANDIKSNMENEASKSVKTDALESQVKRLEEWLDAAENDASNGNITCQQGCFEQIVKLVRQELQCMDEKLCENQKRVGELSSITKEIESLSDMVKKLPDRVNGQESQTLRFLSRANQELERMVSGEVERKREWDEKAVALNNQMRTLQQACDTIQQSIEAMEASIQTSTKQLDLLMPRLGICKEGSGTDGL